MGRVLEAEVTGHADGIIAGGGKEESSMTPEVPAEAPRGWYNPFLGLDMASHVSFTWVTVNYVPKHSTYFLSPCLYRFLGFVYV